MKILGFRGDTKAPRYAIVTSNAGIYELENTSSDNKLMVPASISDEADADRLRWVYLEIERIFDAHRNIAKVIIKCNEFAKVGMETKAKRRSAYIDAAVLLACANHGKPAEIKNYASIGTNSAETKNHAVTRVGKTDKYWDTKMADAINAAW